jgi:hypothetical protein
MLKAPPRKRMTTAQRREFYNAACGGNEFPMCNLCPQPVLPREEWVESHVPIPHAWNGKETGVAHKRCNDLYWQKVEAPRLAKARHQYDMARGIKVARNPVRGGRQDPWKRKMDGTVVDRETGKPWGSRKDD